MMISRMILAVCLALAIAGCDNAPSEPDRADEKPAAGPTRTVALVMKTLTNPFFVEMEKGARRAEKELGIALIVKTAAQETSIEQQIAIVEDLTRGGVDAIVVAPGDSIKMIPALKQAQERGIVVVNIDNRLDSRFSEKSGLSGVPFVSVDNQNGAYLAARYAAQHMTGTGPAAVLEGIRSASNAQARARGALQAFGEFPAITEVFQETANWKIDEAYAVAGQLFRDHPDIRVVFAANDMMAFGVIRLLRELGRTDVSLASFDALDEAKAAIRAGDLQATVDQQAGQQGYLGVRYAVELLDGRQVPAVTMVDATLVTAESP